MYESHRKQQASIYLTSDINEIDKNKPGRDFISTKRETTYKAHSHP